MAQQVAKIKLTKLLAKNHLTALEKNQLTLTFVTKTANFEVNPITWTKSTPPS